MSKLSWLHLSVGWVVLALGQPVHPEPPQKDKKATKSPPSHTDLYGDPLPAGAIARMGTIRWRHAQEVSFVAFLPDGNSVLTACEDQGPSRAGFEEA